MFARPLLLLLVPLCCGAPALAAPLDWLAGCWAAADAEPGSGEQWTAPAGGSLLGVSRTVKAGRTVAHEFMQVRETADGWVFIALPSGQRETTFKAVRLGERDVVFENPTHDFPQRVVYASPDTMTLNARIEGRRGNEGAQRVVPFPMRRVACPLGTR